MNNLKVHQQDRQSTYSALNFSSVSKKRILIVDDDTESVQSIYTFLMNEGFETTICNDGLKALQEANRIQYQLILLDIIVPNLDGFELLKKLRLNNKTPVIIMTSRDDLFDKIYSLEIGADDYLTKPVNRRELLARMNAITRRIRVEGSQQVNKVSSVNDISFSLSTRDVYCRGCSLNLTGYEFEVLHFLVINAGSIVSKDSIAEYVHGRSVPYNDRSIDMHICNIRKKISTLVADQKIKTIRSAGYIFLKEVI